MTCLRSKPVALVVIQTRKGKPTFRVTGTVDGRQRKRQFMDRANAEAQRDVWEVERMSAAAALRPKITRLTQAQLAEAEACFELLKSTGFSLADAVRALLRKPPATKCDLVFDVAYKQFLQARKGFISDAQYFNYETVCRRLAAYLSAGAKLCDIDTDKIHTWLSSLGILAKSWNNYRGDLAVVFNWFIAAPRRWITDNPATPLPRFRKRDALPGKIDVLTCDIARDLMHWLEREKPHWVTIFALALFAGIRPDRDDGEMAKLVEALKRGEAGKIFRGDSLFLTAAMTKDGRPRRVPLPDNLRTWLQQYPATEMSLRGGTRSEYASIRAKWKIPHDGLRHTSISACATMYGVTEAATRHGNSEKICRDHYLSLFSVIEAKSFYCILPAGSARAAANR